jgi:chitinase
MVLGHHAALYVRGDEVGDQRYLNVDWATNYWINKGCPRNKLNLGLGTYGRAFKLANANNNGLGAAASSLPTAGTVS